MLFFRQQKKSRIWVEIKFQRNIWGQLDVMTRMRASKFWNFDLEKSIEPMKMDSCIIFADHCMTILLNMYEKRNMTFEGLW